MKATVSPMNRLGRVVKATTGRMNQMADHFFSVNCCHCAEEISILSSTCKHCGKSQRQEQGTHTPGKWTQKHFTKEAA